jgi:putative Ca2+/H+ antiporter (TMEM165/GDT1 family)
MSRAPLLDRLDTQYSSDDLNLSNSNRKLSFPKIDHSAGKYLLSTFPLLLLLWQSPAHAMDIVQTVKDSASNSGFIQSFLLIFVSEIGDKTFFIAALLAAKYGRLISFSGSLGALAVMTIISTVIGQLFHAVPSSLTQGIPYDDYIAVAAFAYFGIKTLIETSKIDSSDVSAMDEEKAEAEELIQESITDDAKRKSTISLILQVFSLVFAGEIGDRSFLSNIALSAALNPYAVASGAILAHGIATGIAVIGGAILSKYLSEKVIGYVGGVLFIIFAITTAVGLF